jgi:hypothetical protein
MLAPHAGHSAFRNDTGAAAMRIGWLLIVAPLFGCAGPPLADMTDVNPVVYQRDLDQCQIEAQAAEPAGPLVAGAVMGASFGMGLGALATGMPATAAAVGYGGAAGAAAGAGLSAVTGAPLAAPPPAPRQSVADCLTARGYKMIERARE